MEFDHLECEQGSRISFVITLWLFNIMLYNEEVVDNYSGAEMLWFTKSNNEALDIITS